MLEIAIAVGIGLWFIISGLVSYFALSKSFKKDKLKGDKDK